MYLYVLIKTVCIIVAVSWLSRLVTGLSLTTPRFAPNSVHVRFVVDKVALGLVFIPVHPFSPVSIIPQMLHTHSFIYHRRCIMFFSQYSSFPRQYHSTNAPYSFIRLPPTLYNVFLPVLQFPLSVPFHQCCIPIHSAITDNT
jgi:hypothetical protein